MEKVSQISFEMLGFKPHDGNTNDFSAWTLNEGDVRVWELGYHPDTKSLNLKWYLLKSEPHIKIVVFDGLIVHSNEDARQLLMRVRGLNRLIPFS